MKKNKFLAVILAVVVAVGAAGVTTYAVGKDANDTEAPSAVVTAASASDTEAVKDETVYVMTAADGSTQKILVSDWIKNALPAEAQKAIESLNDAQQVKDDCWTGTIQKELPVSMSIHYTLDGKTVTPSELAGKSGKVTIRFEYENHCTTTATVDGKEETLWPSPAPCWIPPTSPMSPSPTVSSSTTATASLLWGWPSPACRRIWASAGSSWTCPTMWRSAPT